MTPRLIQAIGLLVVAVTALVSSACATVPPHDRGRLALPTMVASDMSRDSQVPAAARVPAAGPQEAATAWLAVAAGAHHYLLALGDTGEIPVVYVPKDEDDEDFRLYPPRHWVDGRG